MPLSADLVVPSNARLGWTYEEQASVICSELVHDHATLYSNIYSDVSQFPRVNDDIVINQLPFTIIFSVAIQIEPRCKCEVRVCGFGGWAADIILPIGVGP